MPTGIYPRKIKSPEQRFWMKVKKTKSCWNWIGYSGGVGYGYLNINTTGKTKLISVHRFSYKLHFGKVPRGICVLHSCDNRRCVNPQHLFLGTKKDNIQDMLQKKRNKAKQYGRCHPKLNFQQVKQIKKLYAQKVKSLYQLAIMFNVTYPSIWKIINNKTHIFAKSVLKVKITENRII